MSRCDFGGMIIFPAKISSSQFEWMLTICQLNYLPDQGLYLRPENYVSFVIPAKIYNWIFSSRAKKILMAGTFSDSWNRKNQWRERIPNQRKRVQNWREHILRSEKENSDENSRVQRSGIGLIAEFHKIPNGFPNQVSIAVAVAAVVVVAMAVAVSVPFPSPSMLLLPLLLQLPTASCRHHCICCCCRCPHHHCCPHPSHRCSCPCLHHHQNLSQVGSV